MLRIINGVDEVVGIYFNGHFEEADQWRMEHMVYTREKRIK